MYLYSVEDFKNAKFNELLKVKCDTCNKIFERSKHLIVIARINKRSKHFCSNKCSGKSHATKTYHSCITCGYPTKTKFCSHSCSAKYSNVHRVLNRPKKERKRSYKKCTYCGNIRCNNRICVFLRHGGIKTFKKFGFDALSVEKFKEKLKSLLRNSSIFEICYNYDVQLNSMCGLLDVLNLKKKTSRKFGQGFWYTTWNNKKVFLRSSLELKMAKEFDNQQIDYVVNGLKIPYINSRGLRKIYIPDFYIPSKNLVVETKGSHFLDEECKPKSIATKDLGYNYKFILDGKEIPF